MMMMMMMMMNLVCIVEIYQQFYWSFTYGFCEDCCYQSYWHCCKWKCWWIDKTVQFTKAHWSRNIAAPWR